MCSQYVLSNIPRYPMMSAYLAILWCMTPGTHWSALNLESARSTWVILLHAQRWMPVPPHAGGSKLFPQRFWGTIAPPPTAVQMGG